MTRPALVALTRAIIEAIVLAIIGVLIVALTEVDSGQLAPWAPIGVLALRQLEGLADERIDPSKARGTLGRTLAGTTARTD